jgi:uncharacterized protein (DUF983 family)
MTTKEQQTVKTIATPIRFDGRYGCPRCRGRLFFDGDELVCVVCGYEYYLENAAA